MAWRWVEKLKGTKNSRSRKDAAKRRLTFEQRRLAVEPLECRRLLSTNMIMINGTIAVSNLACASQGSNVPVRGIHVHAWIGDNATYNNDPANTAEGLNGTGPGGVYNDVYTNNQGEYTVLLFDEPSFQHPATTAMS